MVASSSLPAPSPSCGTTSSSMAGGDVEVAGGDRAILLRNELFSSITLLSWEGEKNRCNVHTQTHKGSCFKPVFVILKDFSAVVGCSAVVSPSLS